MDDLREQIAREVYEAVGDPNFLEMPDAKEIADRILALELIREALWYRRACRCVTPLSESYLGHRMSGDTCIDCGITQLELNKGHPLAPAKPLNLGPSVSTNRRTPV
jgi:hypothetical protein